MSEPDMLTDLRFGAIGVSVQRSSCLRSLSIFKFKSRANHSHFSICDRHGICE